MNYKKGTQTRGCMKSVMRYVSQTSKTLWDGQQLVSGIGCQPKTAFDEFLSTKLLHHKDGGVMFYHMRHKKQGSRKRCPVGCAERLLILAVVDAEHCARRGLDEMVHRSAGGLDGGGELRNVLCRPAEREKDG